MLIEGEEVQEVCTEERVVHGGGRCAWGREVCMGEGDECGGGR